MTSQYSVGRKPTPFQMLLLGYAVVTLVGACLLSLPLASARGAPQSFLDALFLSTSGISTTGLSVVDVGTYYSRFGQIVLLTIVQIGGIGYMALVIGMTYLLGMRISLRTSLVAQESLAGSSSGLFRRFFVSVLAFTFAFQFVGAVILALFWMQEYPVSHSIYLGIFHAVSAFCTAGFVLFPDNLMTYAQSHVVNATVIVVSLAGGVGFFVLKDLTLNATRRIKKVYPVRLTVHTRLVLITTAVVVLIGAAAIFLAEDWPVTANSHEKALVSVFQAVSASTTDGFNTIDIGKMSPVSLTATMVLMFIGASPGSTGGGIKTTTFAVLLLLLGSKLRGTDTNVFRRRISDRCIYDAIVVFLCFVLVVFVDMLILTVTERSAYIQTMFEVFSALGNTGLSTGITSGLSKTGRAVLIVTMFIGRVGPLIIGYALLFRPGRGHFRNATEDVLVG